VEGRRERMRTKEMHRLMLVEGGRGGECVRMLSADSSRPEDHTARPPCVPSALFANISAIKHWTDSYSDLTTFLANAPVVSRLVLRSLSRSYWYSGVVTFVKSSQTPCSERKLERLSSACRAITKEHSRPIPDGIHCGYASPAFSDTEKAISYCEVKLLEVVLENVPVNLRGANARQTRDEGLPRCDRPVLFDIRLKDLRTPVRPDDNKTLIRSVSFFLGYHQLHHFFLHTIWQRDPTNCRTM
ncbi:hypothetical protein ALC60_08266, partial [Trachymyrmex zeteki]